MYTEKDLMKVHQALHNEKKERAIVSGGRQYIIKTAKNGCRMVELETGVVMEQNPKKASSYARRAQKGEKLSWFIPDGEGDWKLIEDFVY